MEKYMSVMRHFIVLLFYSAIQFTAFQVSAEIKSAASQFPNGAVVTEDRDLPPTLNRPIEERSFGGIASGGTINIFANPSFESSPLEALEKICNLTAQYTVTSEGVAYLIQLSQKQYSNECENHDGSAISISNCELKIQRMNRVFLCF